jgi:predicted phosphoribosyltransferase
MFKDRIDAGEQLSDLLRERGVEADLVLGIPRGGVPVARVVADRLGAPLDVVVAEKIGAPYNPELAIGAVAGDGSVWLNEELIERLGVSDGYVQETREEEAENARRKVERFHAGESLADVRGKRVVLVDDGLATGATAVACLRQIRNGGADRVVLAVPVAAPDSVERLRDEADEIVAVQTPEHFGAVGQYYRSFGQVSEKEAESYLRER